MKINKTQLDSKIFSGISGSPVEQDDTLIVKFDKNYQKFSIDTPFQITSVIDPDTQLPVDIELEIDLTDAVLGNSVQIYTTGVAPFASEDSVNFQNLEIYKEDAVNLIILDYKSDIDVTAVVINSIPLTALKEIVEYIPKSGFTSEVRFNKDYEVGDFNERVQTFTLDLTNKLTGSKVIVFYNDVALPVDSNIVWINDTIFETNTDFMIELYNSKSKVIGTLTKI